MGCSCKSTPATDKRTRAWAVCVRAQAQIRIAAMVKASTKAKEKLAAKESDRHTEQAAAARGMDHSRAWLWAASEFLRSTG